MSAAELNPDDAAQAPALVRDRQQQVLAVPPLPGWFWARACGRSSPGPDRHRTGRVGLTA
ncbi:hypothetical protein GCM10009827_061350 [Dactylosporangium maewongense]|uniref:Uncharacterized protein n=1 Tax=Dactylosporangium maewongense TaxID=634393 RepID=A0ABP4M010_9ACTN